MEAKTASSALQGGGEAVPAAAEFVAKCECCGLTEECTPEYIGRVRERHGGRWICGLCSEAVNDETSRSKRGVVTPDEALKRHMKFCQQFKSCSPPKNPTEDLISAMKNLLQRSLDSPRNKKPSVYLSSSPSSSSSSPLVR
ncbi:hypothetical protein Tsubulata_020573 [Turnera subulata]|uniref:DUF1677 family protein n=1 Tax=Turnera subulata TaxID=218843 RepID=A0A9Q0JL06_9ROSI|nr:hypothetical protein Tsubulata_020573 [Turnera subulata]